MVSAISTHGKYEFRRLQAATADLWASDWHANNHGVKAPRLTKEELLSRSWKKAQELKVRPKALNPKKKVPVTLEEKIVLSRDTRLFRFSLPSQEHVLGLPVGGHFFVNAHIDGAPVMRAYTPTSGDDEVGYFDLVVKVYFKNVHPKFPDGGKMSQYLDSLSPGDTVDIKGPIGHFTYLGNGRIQIHKEERIVKEIGFICGGTGITPAYQVNSRPASAAAARVFPEATVHVLQLILIDLILLCWWPVFRGEHGGR